MFSNQAVSLEDAVKKGMFPLIETFPCPYDSNKAPSGVIRIVFPEFTCVCPRTGYPDFGSIIILYLPNKLCLELKSWKLYLNGFRMVGTFHETVTAHFYDILTKLLHPNWLMVAGDFFPRGNIDTTVVFESSTPRPRGADVLIGQIKPHCRSFGTS